MGRSRLFECAFAALLAALVGVPSGISGKPLFQIGVVGADMD